jgi:hypothetical protein
VSKLREAANGQSCVRCGAQDETVVLAHYSGPWQHRFGKGKGIKGNDAAGADLCYRCHTDLDEYQTAEDEVSSLRRSEEFLACCLLTVIRRIQKGVLR